MRNKDVAIPIVFPDYTIAVKSKAIVIQVPDLLPKINILPRQITIPKQNHHLPYLGHAGVLFIEGQSGLTRYYEYGRYDPAELGETRKRSVPDVKMGRNGRPTRKTLAATLADISRKAGQHGRIEGAYIELDSPAFIRMEGYAMGRFKENTDKKRTPYDLTDHSCLHFMKDTVETGGATLPMILAPNPAGYIVQVQLQEHDLEFELKTNTVTVDDIDLE